MNLEENVLLFHKPAHSGSGAFFIDIAQSMSIVNRKGYDQQGLWTVLGANVWVEDASVSPTVGIPYTATISGAPRNWVCRNSLVKIESLWLDQQRDAQRAISSSIKPIWEDFKVFLNKDHFTAGVAGNLTPVSGSMFGGISAYNTGEWIHSKIVWEEANAAGAIVEAESALWILGPDDAVTEDKGIINQYAESRALVQSPDPALPALIQDSLYTVATDPLADQMVAIVENMKVDNDEPPYDRSTYPGGNSNGNDPQLYAYASNTNTLGRKLTLNGFSAPNGLLELVITPTLAQEPTPHLADVWIQLIIGRRSDY